MRSSSIRSRQTGVHVFYKETNNNFHAMAGYHLPGCHDNMLANAWKELPENDKSYFSAQAKIKNRDAQRLLRNRRFAARAAGAGGTKKTGTGCSAATLGGFGSATYPVSMDSLLNYSREHSRTGAHTAFREYGTRMTLDNVRVHELFEDDHMKSVASRWVAQCSL